MEETHEIDGIVFSVPGEVRGKGRPRIVKIGGYSRMKADEKTVSYEGTWATAANSAMGGQPLMDGPIRVDIRARFLPPASASKKKREAMLAGQVFPTRKPDLDNIVKCLDALNGIVFRDDAAIVSIRATKIYAEKPGVDVRIAVLGHRP